MEADQAQFTAKEQAEIEKFCKEYGSNVNGYTPFQQAIHAGKIEIVNYLSQVADVHVKDEDHGGDTLLHNATFGCGHNGIEVIKILISAGIDVNAKNRDGTTPLHYAAISTNIHIAASSQVKVVEYLVSVGADVNAKNYKGETPLHVAVSRGRIEVVKFLVSKGANVNAKDYAHTRFNTKHNGGTTPLHKAACRGSIEIVRFLVSEGADVHAKSRHGITPLYRAVSSYEASFSQKLAVVKFLISNGADIHAKDDDGNTLLHRAVCPWAVSHPSDEVVKMLVSSGLDVQAKNKDGNTPLHMAVENEFHTGSLGVVKYLVSKKADANAKNNNGLTPLDVAKESMRTSEEQIRPGMCSKIISKERKARMAIIKYLESQGKLLQRAKITRKNTWMRIRTLFLPR